jgi:UDP-2,4-diacetamido-2,4,6-trideoxy-beta-L-altropyranose hydrolase
MPRVAFRCDASRAIGSGHLARCMALARALKSRGAEIELLSRNLEPRMTDLLVADTGAIVHELAAIESPRARDEDQGEPLAHAHWLGVSQARDAADTLAILDSRPRFDWLIVDHYGLDARWERAVRPRTGRILAVDDMADREHACDALLDQNFFIDPEARYDGLVPPYAERMLGPRYALLRREFAQMRTRLPERSGKLQRIFVCFGGFDGLDQTVRAVEGIAAARIDGLAVDIVIGSDHPQRAMIEAHCARHDGWQVHLDASNMAALMAPADLAIGASGIMNWERAALRLPAIVAGIAENQHLVARDLAADRACIYLGTAHDWEPQTVAGLLRGLKGTPSLLRALAGRAGELADGRGAERVAARLLPTAVALRPATAADCDDVHAWRNADEARAASLDQRRISLEEHRAWYSRALRNPDLALLIAERGGEPVGVLRYDLSAESATVSIYMVPGQHGQGLGTALLRAGSRWMREQHPRVRRLRAEIRRDNARSRQAFENAGYALSSHVYTLDLRHE